MKALFKNTVIIIFGSVVLYACGHEKQKNTPKPEAQPVQKVQPVAATGTYKKGDHVPSETVCMVNNAYMGKKQMEVPHGGKMYYGCCEMCVEKIPNDKSVREAVDPFTGKKVDKANAYIVMVSDEGEVAYFENEENYKQFLAQNS